MKTNIIITLSVILNMAWVIPLSLYVDYKWTEYKISNAIEKAQKNDK